MKRGARWIISAQAVDQWTSTPRSRPIGPGRDRVTAPKAAGPSLRSVPYASLYDHHLRPCLGSIALREVTAELIGRWQADRLAAGAVAVSVRHAMDLLGSILEHAFMGGRLSENPARRGSRRLGAHGAKRCKHSPRRRSRRCVQPSAHGTQRSCPFSRTPEFALGRRLD